MTITEKGKGNPSLEKKKKSRKERKSPNGKVHIPQKGYTVFAILSMQFFAQLNVLAIKLSATEQDAGDYKSGIVSNA